MDPHGGKLFLEHLQAQLDGRVNYRVLILPELAEGDHGVVGVAAEFIRPALAKVLALKRRREAGQGGQREQSHLNSMVRHCGEGEELRSSTEMAWALRNEPLTITCRETSANAGSNDLEIQYTC